MCTNTYIYRLGRRERERRNNKARRRKIRKRERKINYLNYLYALHNNNIVRNLRILKYILFSLSHTHTHTHTHFQLSRTYGSNATLHIPTLTHIRP